MKKWHNNAETAALKLPGLPPTIRGLNAFSNRHSWKDRRNLAGDPLARRRQGKGGGWEYHYTVWPIEAQAKLIAAAKPKREETPNSALCRSESWRFFEKLPEKRKETARKRLAALDAVEAMVRGGMTKNAAVHEAALRNGTSAATVYNWFKLVAGVERVDRLPALGPRHAGRAATKTFDGDAWEMFKADYLRPERPTLESCYRRLRAAAEKHGWTIPGPGAVKRRLVAGISAPIIVLNRHGLDALKAMYPAQERDRSVFHALEAVNADGHQWDLFVKWPDGHVGRPVMVAFQDIHSGKILSWRIDRSENREAVRLAFGDLVEIYGIPSHAYMDNGRAFASKWLTGGIENRFRFKIKEEDPVGILTQLGVTVHWTLPYSGQSKPIERAFRDFCNDIAKHPALAGAWTGNRPENKPANHGSRSIPIEDFINVVSEGIAEHNARPGRRSRVCAGRSFDEAFNESYAQAEITKITGEQRRLWLLAAEGVKAAGRDGAIRLMGNRYWASFLHEHRRQSLTARIDPDNLHDGIHVYRLDGSYLGLAECIEAAGFNDVTAAREHGRARRSWMKAQKEAADALVKLDPDAVADLMAEPGDAPPPGSKVVRMMAARPVLATKAAKPEPAPLTDEERRIADAKWRELTGEGEGEDNNVIALPTNDPGGRPYFQTDEAFARWMLANPGRMDGQDKAYLDELLESRSFRMLIDYEEQKESRGA